MAKRIYSTTPGAGLELAPTNSFSYYIEVDKDGDPETLALKMDKLIRSRIGKVNSDANYDFTDYNSISRTITGDETGVVSGIPAGSVAYLNVTKGASDTLTLSGVDVIYPESQYGFTKLIYEIHNAYGLIIAKRLNNVNRIELVQADLDCDDIIITAFDHFRIDVIGNQAFISTQFTFIYNKTPELGEIYITFSSGLDAPEDFTPWAATLYPPIPLTVKGGKSSVTIYKQTAFGYGNTYLFNGKCVLEIN